MKKLLLTLALSVLLACMVMTAVYAAVGDVNGVALHTDIVAYINNYAIPSYAVNGQSCIVAEDLANFGFDVRWDGSTMTLYITRGSTSVVNEQSFTKLNESGSFFSNTLETEVKVYANEQKLTSYAINGFTMIPVEELTMFGNIQWVPDEAALKMWVDGLDTRESKQLIVRRFSPVLPAQTTVEVATAKQFLDAIGSNKRIVLTSKTYNLSEVAYVDNQYIKYNEYTKSMHIDSVENMTIVGNAEIVIDDIYSTVLDFENCSNIELNGLTIGHTYSLDEYACEGPVVGFYKCSNITIDNCNLFGCGSIGIWASQSLKLNANNCNIYDCSLNGIAINDSHDITIEKTSFYDSNFVNAFCSANDSSATFVECSIYNISTENFIDIYNYGDIATVLNFNNCYINNNSFSEIVNYSQFIGFDYTVPKKENNFEINFNDCYFDGNTGNMKHENVNYINEGIKFNAPVQFSDSEIMYALDGRSIIVEPSEIEAHKKVGWYDIESYTLIQAEKFVAEQGYPTAISTMKKYTNSWEYEYIYDTRTRAAVESAINVLLKKWYQTSGEPLVVLDWYKSENSIGTPEINITFMNISDKTIVAFETMFTCYDAYGDATTDYPNLYNGSFKGHVDDTYLAPGNENIYTWTLYSNERTTRISWPTIFRIAFEDGSVWKK